MVDDGCHAGSAGHCRGQNKRRGGRIYPAGPVVLRRIGTGSDLEPLSFAKTPIEAGKQPKCKAAAYPDERTSAVCLTDIPAMPDDCSDTP